MVCGDQPMDRLTSILKLDTKPHTINELGRQHLHLHLPPG